MKKTNVSAEEGHQPIPDLNIHIWKPVLIKTHLEGGRELFRGPLFYGREKSGPSREVSCWASPQAGWRDSNTTPGIDPAILLLCQDASELILKPLPVSNWVIFSLLWANVLFTLSSFLPAPRRQPITYDSGRNHLPHDPQCQRQLREDPRPWPGTWLQVRCFTKLLLYFFLGNLCLSWKTFQNDAHYRRNEYSIIPMTAELAFKPFYL